MNPSLVIYGCFFFYSLLSLFRLFRCRTQRLHFSGMRRCPCASPLCSIPFIQTARKYDKNHAWHIHIKHPTSFAFYNLTNKTCATRTSPPSLHPYLITAESLSGVNLLLAPAKYRSYSDGNVCPEEGELFSTLLLLALLPPLLRLPFFLWLKKISTVWVNVWILPTLFQMRRSRDRSQATVCGSATTGARHWAHHSLSWSSLRLSWVLLTMMRLVSPRTYHQEINSMCLYFYSRRSV